MIFHARAQITAGGMGNVNLNEVLRLSGGSKATLVKYFGDKTGLVAAAIGEEAKDAMSQLRDSLDRRGAGRLEDALPQLLAGILRFYLTPAALGLYRAVIATGGATGEMFFATGHAVVVAHVSTFLKNSGRLRPDLDLDMAAERLVHMIRAGTYERALLGMIPLLVPQAEIEREAAETAALFLQGASPDPD